MEVTVNLSEKPEGHTGLKTSQYTLTTRLGDGRLVLYNTLSGSMHVLPEGNAASTEVLLTEPNGPSTLELDFLTKKGYVVPADRDEHAMVRLLKDRYRADDHLNLGLLSSEQCNFRCIYCYELFKRGTMEPDVQQGVLNYVSKNIRYLRTLKLSWFGGEPLLARDVVERLGTQIRRMCEDWDVGMTGGITTNGYFLTHDTVAMLFATNVTSMQVTLDGTAASHDRHRKLIGGQKTWERIWNNIVGLHSFDTPFKCRIRVNFDRDVVETIPELIDLMADAFASDPRFTVDFFPIGKWGGPNDDQLDVFDNTEEAYKIGFQFGRIAVERGLHVAAKDFIGPCASVCYAADPRSFIIGANGTVYKCTVAFEDERNHVGTLLPDGTMNLRSDKYAMWVEADDGEDTGCQSCFFRPSCMGASCPLERLNTGHRPCPPVKKNIKTVIELVALDAVRPTRPAVHP